MLVRLTREQENEKADQMSAVFMLLKMYPHLGQALE